MVVWADWMLVDSQLNHMVNRNVAGEFGPIGDTGTTSDKRYSDAAITEARRKAAVRILEAVGSNVSHPYWGELKTDVEVDHLAKIPPYFGEIGIPLIKPFLDIVVSRTITNGQKAASSSLVTFSAGTGGASVADAGRRIVIEYIDTATNDRSTVLDATILSAPSADSVNVGNFSVGDYETAISTGLGWTVVTTIYIDDAQEPTADSFQTGIPADADEVDSYRRDTKGVFGDPFGSGSVAHDSPTVDGLPSPLSLRYSTDNSVLKFTGALCRIPMIVKPFEDLTIVVLDGYVVDGVTIVDTEDVATGCFPDWVDGLSVNILSGDIEIITGAEATWIDQTSISMTDASTADNTNAIATFYGTLTPDAAMRRMLDLFIPADLSSLLVKLALPMLVKEGDNLFRMAAYLGQEGERELMGVRAGGIKAAPVDPKKLIEFSQKLS
jgi:hypothetical protein